MAATRSGAALAGNFPLVPKITQSNITYLYQLTLDDAINNKNETTTEIYAKLKMRSFLTDKSASLSDYLFGTEGVQYMFSEFMPCLRRLISLKIARDTPLSMASSVQQSFFADSCRNQLRTFLDQVFLIRESVGDRKQTITFGISPALNSVEFRYRGLSIRLDCQSRYQFPETEQDLVAILGEDGTRAVRLTGLALVAAPNAMALISGSYNEILKLASSCHFVSHEKASFAFPIRIDWTHKELGEAAQAQSSLDLGQIKIDRHRFLLLRQFAQELYGEWILGILDAPAPDTQIGLWTMTFPGGKRLLGETSLECCLREVREEIGLVGDLDAILREDDLSRVSIDSKFCAFVLHLSHFIADP